MSKTEEVIQSALAPFAKHFHQERTWQKAQVLVKGTLLAQGRRVVTGALRMMGLQDGPSYNQYHHVLSRAKWSGLALGRTLLLMLVSVFSKGEEPLIFGIDETIERRWGDKIKARGIYRDSVRSSRSYLVKVSGLRWISIMLLTPIQWADRVWALPILTILAPSERYFKRQGRSPKTLLERALLALQVLKRWLPDRDVVAVGDGSYAALEFLHGCQTIGVTLITRLRLDAALYDPAPPYSGRGRPRKKGARQPTLETRLHTPQTSWQVLELTWYDGQTRHMEITTGTAWWFHYGLSAVPMRWVLVRDPDGCLDSIAILCTDDQRDPVWIVEAFVQRWQVEVTFEEARRHLGVESQRQWSDQAIARTTPVLLGLFSWVTYLTQLFQQAGIPIQARQTAWYTKSRPTFSDALALVRQHLWQLQHTFLMSDIEHDMIKIPRAYLNTLLDAACYAA